MTEEEIINKFPSPHVAEERTGWATDYHKSKRFASFTQPKQNFCLTNQAPNKNGSARHIVPTPVREIAKFVFAKPNIEPNWMVCLVGHGALR